MKAKPRTYGKHNSFCDPQCPHLKHTGEYEAKCTLLDYDLDFYDWYLSICVRDNVNLKTFQQEYPRTFKRMKKHFGIQ